MTSFSVLTTTEVTKDMPHLDFLSLLAQARSELKRVQVVITTP